METETLTRSDYGVIDKSDTAHLKDADGTSTFCRKPVIGEVPEGGWVNKSGYHTGQHCIQCDQTWRATMGTVAVCYEF